ncbi:MAG TPA: LEA type 2 family protein [Luteimonas sp.]|nr:LEA type 2 family protein [Luteimonas sp.]
MKRAWRIAAWIACLVLVGCSTGPVRRVSEPAASIQQLTVAADGSWSLELRVQNYSSVPMRFDTVTVEVVVDDAQAGTLQATPALTVGPESADVLTLPLAPASAARIALANALASGRGVGYRLGGTLRAAPADRGGARDYPLKHASQLSPVPGLPGVLR